MHTALAFGPLRKNILKCVCLCVNVSSPLLQIDTLSNFNSIYFGISRALFKSLC